MDKNLVLIRELRTKKGYLEKQTCEIDERIRKLKKRHFGADEGKQFTFELLEAVLTEYLTKKQIKEIVKNFEVSFERLELILKEYLTEEEVKEIINNLKEL